MGTNAPPDLPSFTYYRDPLKTGQVIPSQNKCVVCRKVRGFVYRYADYYSREYIECICPWCIADGSAHRRLHVVFNKDISASPTFTISPEVLDEIKHRTPGFVAWQEEFWLCHCNDAAVYIDAIGYPEWSQLSPQAKLEFRNYNSQYEDDAWGKLMLVLDRAYWPTGYLFQCRHCEQYLGYIDWGGITPPICGWKLFGCLWRFPRLCRFLFLLRRSIPLIGLNMYRMPRKVVEQLREMQESDQY